MKTLKNKIFGFSSIALGLFGVFFTGNYIQNIINVEESVKHEKLDTLSFLFQNENKIKKETNSFLADFITPSINKYDGYISESMRTCMDGYNQTEVNNLFDHHKLTIENEEVAIQIAEDYIIEQSRQSIKKELMPVFGHAVQNSQINWTWDKENQKYSFNIYTGDEALWYCYFRKETQFFTNFFNLQEHDLKDPLPPISDYTIEATETYNMRINLAYNYSLLGYKLENESIEFITEYKKSTDTTWIKGEKVDYGTINFQKKESNPPEFGYWGNPIDFGYLYDVRIKVAPRSSDDWSYTESDYTYLTLDTRENEYGYYVDAVKKINQNIAIHIFQNENGDIHPNLAQNNGNAWINVYDKKNNKIKQIDLHITEENKNKENDSIKKNFQIDTAGIYSIKICYGQDSNTCEEYGNSSQIEILDFMCKPLFENHNKTNADRINIVFIGSRYNRFSDFLEVVRKSLTWNGKPIPFTYFHNELQIDKVANLSWGLFAIEPFKSNKDKFNLWYVDKPMTSLTRRVDDLCGLPYEYDAIYANRSFLGEMGNTRSHATLPDYSDPVKRDKGNYNKMYHSSHNFYPYDARVNDDNDIDYQLFAHESAHAIFGLYDEYTEGNGDYIRYGDFTCVHNKAEAEKEWGDLIGDLDPFWYTMQEQLKEYKLDKDIDCKRKIIDSYEAECETDENGKIIIEETPREYPLYPKEDFIIQYFEGGCYGAYGDESVIKPTVNSLMTYHSNTILGSVNRREVERVLSMFTGEKITNRTLKIPIINLSTPFIESNDIYATDYIIEYKKQNETTWNTKSINTDYNEKFIFGIENAEIYLEKNNIYDIKVKQVNKFNIIDESNFSEIFTIDTNNFLYPFSTRVRPYTINFNIKYDENEEVPSDLINKTLFFIIKDESLEDIKFSTKINTESLETEKFVEKDIAISLEKEKTYFGYLCLGDSLETCKKRGFYKDLKQYL